MSKEEKLKRDYLSLKIIQSGEIIKIALTEVNLKIKFKEYYHSILKNVKAKERNIFISNEEGKMLRNSDLELPLKLILEKFGYRLKLYSEKIF